MDRARIVALIESLVDDEAAQERAFNQARSEWQRLLLALARNAASRFEEATTATPLTLAAAGEEKPPPGWARPDADALVPHELVAMLAKRFRDAAGFYAVRLLKRGAGELARAGVNFDVRSPLLEGVLPDAGLRITRIAETTRRETMRVLDDAWRQGMSIPEARQSLAAHGLHYARERAEMIARTEIIGARNGASVAMVRITGAAERKVWLATEDERTRPTHAEADGQSVPLDAAFMVGESQMMYPGDQSASPEEVVNCRCTVTYEVVEEDEEGIVAAVEPTDSVAVRWRSVVALEDTWTDDGRWFAPGSVEWRELPLTLMAQIETAPGHDGARVAGRIDSLTREGNQIVATGVFDSGPDGVEAARLVADETLRGVSVDVGGIDVEIEEVEQDDGLVFYRERYSRAVILGATITPFPAFADASISIDDGGDAEPVAEDAPVEDADVVVAAAAPLKPPAWWFEAPRFTGPTPLTITDDGRVYGHVATWDTCHTGRSDVCMTPPHSATGYAHFHLGELVTKEGEVVPVGQITLNTAHATLAAGPGDAAAHYDHTGTAAADVRAGEDEWGIWVAGALRPSVKPEDVRTLRAAKPSGDWRRIGGVLELIGLLAVNVPGFPVPRVRLASGAPQALVASSGHPPHREADGAVRYPPQILHGDEVFADAEARDLVTAARTNLRRLVTRARG